MYWFDTIIVALLILAGLLGARCGFLGQIARVLCLGISIFAAIIFHEPSMRFLSEDALRDANVQVASLLAYGSVFLITYLVLARIFRFIREGLQESELDIFDRVFGALLGTAKMALVVGAVCLGLANARNPSTETIMEHSTLATTFADGGEKIVAMIPEEYKLYLGEKVQEWRGQWTK